MGTATFRATLTNGQYKKGNFTDKDGSVYEGIHVFTTLNRRNQRIIPLVSTENEVELSSMNPNSNIAQPSDVIAKINGNVFVSNSCPVGFNYEGVGGNFYAGKWVYQAAPDLGSDNKSAYKNPKFSPSFCVKSNGDAVIRWFSSKEKLQIAMDACDCIIAGAHALVFDGKCVLDEEVYDAETDSLLIYSLDGDGYQAATRWDTSVSASGSTKVSRRTCLGHKSGSNGIYIMVCTGAAITLRTAARLMECLGCDYAVNLDGNGSVQMRIKNGYGASGKVTSGVGRTIFAGVAAYLV